MSVKMSWGKTQEASALYCIMNMFPDALLEEVRVVLGFPCIVGLSMHCRAFHAL
jgi:hypothetical protein